MPPSWSWTSLDAVIEWVHQCLGPNFTTAVDFEVLEALVHPAGLDPFGQGQAGLVRLRRRVTIVQVVMSLTLNTYELWDSLNMNLDKMEGSEGGDEEGTARTVERATLYVYDVFQLRRAVLAESNVPLGFSRLSERRSDILR